MTRKNAIFRWILSNAVLATLTFLCAGKTNPLMLRAYLATVAALGLVMTLVVEPALLEERSNPGRDVLDPYVGMGTSFLFLLTVVIATLDSGRLHWTENIGQPAETIALVLLAVVTTLQIWAMVVNPFFSTGIRVQTERGHHLITHGPYRLVRHPAYFTMILIMPATAIALGSYLALIPAFLYSAVILRRTRQEDSFLKNQLPGYSGYISRVRYMLFPGLW